jgi:two-component system response regulator LytT
MKVVIVEPDAVTAEQLTKLLSKLSEQVEIKVLFSLREANIFFKANHSIDLILSDISVGVGAFFKQKKINIPAIYYSANTNRAIEAFRYNGIDFIIKPFTKKNISASIEKYNALRNAFTNVLFGNNNLSDDLPKNNSHTSSLIVNWKDKIIPVKIKDIALFNIEYKMTQAVTFNNRKYFITNTLEDLEDICGDDFYRANRQFLINREVVAEATQHFARKLVLKLKVEGEHEIIISKNRVPEFLSWLKN